MKSWNISINKFSAQYFIVILITFNLIILQIPIFFNKWAFNDDYRMHIYWMQRFEDPSLLRNDLLSEFSEFFLTPGVIAIYWIGAKTIGVFETSKLLQLLLIIFTGLISYLILREIIPSGYYENVFSLLLIATLPGLYGTLFGGYSRGIGYFLVLTNILAILKERYNIASFILLVCSLFRPTSFLIATSYLSITLFLNFRKEKNYRILIFFIICFLLSLGLILLKYLPANDKFGDVIWYDRNMPEFQNSGRCHASEIKNIFQSIQMETQDTFNTRISIRDISWKKIESFDYVFLGIRIPPLDSFAKVFNKHIFPYLAILGLIFFFLKNNNLNNKVKNNLLLFFAVSLLLFLIAQALALKLYFPDRYIVPIVPLLAIVGIVNMFSIFMEYVKRYNRLNLFFILICCLFLFFHGTGFAPSQGMNIDVSSNTRLLEFIKKFPVNSLIVTNPMVADNIPSFTGHRVFFDREHFLPFYKHFYSVMKDRGKDFSRLYYTSDVNTLMGIAGKNKINYLIIRKNDFSEENLKDDKIFYEPLSKEIKKVIQDNTGAFAWQKLIPDHKIYEDNNFVILKLI